MKKNKKSVWEDCENPCSLTAYEFEEYVAHLFRRMGCHNVKTTSKTGDFGVDAYGYENGQKFLVQCKKFEEPSRVGPEVVQRLAGAVQAERATRGYVVTTFGFSKRAREVAERLPNITLMTVSELEALAHKRWAATRRIERLKKALKKTREFLLSVARICAQCLRVSYAGISFIILLLVILVSRVKPLVFPVSNENSITGSRYVDLLMFGAIVLLIVLFLLMLT